MAGLHNTGATTVMPRNKKAASFRRQLSMYDILTEY